MTGRAVRAGAVMLMLPGSVFAQLGVPAETARYVVRQWDTRTGLPQNTVNEITQTADGYLWLATFGGLVRFDGVRFTSFTSKTDTVIGSDRILHLAADSRGRLWAGTENGVIRLGGGRFATFTARHGLPDNLINDVFADSAGTIWVATEGGLGRYIEASGRFAGIGGVAGIPRQLAEDAHGTLWLRTDEGLFRHDRHSDRFIRDARPGGGARVTMILGRDRGGALWFRTDAGLVRWRPGRLTRVAFRPGLDNAVVRLAQSPDGTLWLASTVSGIRRLAAAADTAAAHQTPLPTGEARYNAKAVFVDREGQVWAGTNVEGLLGFRRRVFTMLPLVQGGEVSTTAILGDRAGRVWIGANCAALNLLEAGRLRVFSGAGGLGITCVWSAAEDSEGALWFGTWGDHLYRYRGGRLEHFDSTRGLSHNVVLAIQPGAAGELWLGTLRGGLNRLTSGRVAVLDTLDGLPSNQVITIRPAQGGGLWVGTTGGLARVRGDSIESWTVRDGLSHHHVRAVLEDADGTVWIGTYGGGLNRLKHGTFRAIGTEQGLRDDAVSAIVDDGRGNLWLSGNHGIFRLSRAQLNAVADGRHPSAHAVGYGAADGLETEETNGGFQPAAWRAPDGRIWFPTIRGVAILDPSAVEPNPAPPRVLVERLAVDGRSVPLADVIRLPRGSGNVEVEYTAISSPAPEAVMFRYRMRGADRDWVHAGERRVANYTRLQPGRYAFAVQAANRDGVWSEAVSPISLIMAPPLQGTWWFRLLLGLALLALPAGLVLLRMQRRARRAQHAFARELLAHQESERKRIASELHDSIGQDLLVMKNRADLALRTTPADAAVREQLLQISHIASDTLRQTRDIAHNLRPAQLDRLGLAAAVRSAVEQVAAASGIEFTVEAGPVDGLLAPEAEIGVFRIVQEGVNNILKHARATTAAVALVRDNGAVRILIRDNGGGFARPGPHQPGFGISGIAERVKLMGGSFQVEGEPGSGVTIRVTIPIPGEAR